MQRELKGTENRINMTLKYLREGFNIFKYTRSELCSMPDLSMLSNYSYRQQLFRGKYQRKIIKLYTIDLGLHYVTGHNEAQKYICT